MSAIDNLGGFVAPAAGGPHDQPASTSLVPVRPADMPLIDLAGGPVQHPTNPFRTSFSGPSTSAQPNLLDVNYPDQAPPSYDSVASSSSAPTPRSPPEKGGASFSPSATPIVSQSSQPQQFLITDNSQPSDLARSPSTKKAEPSEPEYPVASSSTAVVRVQPAGALADQAVNKLTASRNPLDPPPPCFSRVVLQPSETVTYERLPKPFVIHGKPGKNFLDDAFVVAPIPAFHKHDVDTDDWLRFLEDVVTVAKFNGAQKAVTAALPVTRHLLFVGRLASKAVEYGMRKQNTGNVVNLLNVWNERFFNHRRLSVILCKGDYRESGLDRDLPAPDRPHASPRGTSHHDDDDSDSSSSSDSDSDHRGNHSRREEKRRRRAERREQKRARREERRSRRSDSRVEKKDKSRRSYRLVIVSTN